MGTEAKWNAETITDVRLNEMTHLVGTTTEKDASVAWPVDMLWWDTTLKEIYFNDGTEGAPTPKAVGIASGTAFPASPSHGDVFVRTDLGGIATFFDGVNEATVDPPFSHWSAGIQSNRTVRNTVAFGANPFYVDDFTDYADATAFGVHWDTTKEGVEIDFDAANDLISCTPAGTNDDDAISFDLGKTLDDDKWVLRFEIKVNAATQGASATNCLVWLGFNNNDSSLLPNVDGHDFLGLGILVDSANDKLAMIYHATDQVLAVSSVDVTSFELVATTQYFVEMIRTTTTNVDTDIFTGSDYSTGNVLNRSTTVSAAINDLRYLYVGAHTDSANDSTQDTDFLKIEGIKNGVTTW